MPKFSKRTLDIIISVIAIIFCIPLIIIVSVLIKCDSKGPIFFKQERLGLNGSVFRIYKFRTMVINAENIGDGLTVKSSLDSRITKIGYILRKTSLDEIPQLLNVLNGTMSIVGPRPPVIYFPYNGIDNYPEWAIKRFTVKPGITGLSQITVRNSVSWDDRIKIDLKYIDNYSILLDFKIMLRTTKAIFTKNNIYHIN